MAQDKDPLAAAGESLKGFFDMQGEAFREMLAGKGGESLAGPGIEAGEMAEWAATAAQLQQLWLDFATYQTTAAAEKAAKGTNMLDPAQWLVMSQAMLGQMPKGMFEASAKLAQDQMQLWSGVMQSFAAGAAKGMGAGKMAAEIILVAAAGVEDDRPGFGIRIVQQLLGIGRRDDADAGQGGGGGQHGGEQGKHECFHVGKSKEDWEWRN